MNGSALGMQTLEFGENWSSNGFVALPNTQLLGIGSDPSEGTQSTHLIEVFGEELHSTPLLPNNPLSGHWHEAIGTYHPLWEKLVTVGQWDQSTSGRPLLASRWMLSRSSSQVSKRKFFAGNRSDAIPKSGKPWILCDHSLGPRRIASRWLEIGGSIRKVDRHRMARSFTSNSTPNHFKSRLLFH